MENALQKYVQRFWPLLVLAAAGWSVLRWYFLRMTDGSDEPLGLVALAAAAWFAWREPWSGISSRRIVLAAVGLALLAIAPAGTPALVRALIWVGSLAAVSARRVARAGLLAYSLPVMASAQFFGGYPVRVAVTWAAAGLLRMVGLAVSPVATVLVWHHERVLIDAPCSGLQMAWLAGLLALIAANVYALDAKHTARLLGATAAVTFAANALRAAVLFLLETQLRVSAEWMHDVAGLVLFAGVVWTVLARAGVERIDLSETSRKKGSDWERGRLARILRYLGAGEAPALPVRKSVRASAVCFVVFASLAGARPALEAGTHVSPRALHPNFPGWQMAPLDCDRADLRTVPLDPKTRRFAADFPGKLAVFSAGPRTWIVRWVLRPTRKLHSSSDCLRAAGYRVTPGRARVDGKGALWSSFEAKRDGEDLRVCERIAGPNSAAWTDVSAWFWDTFFDSDSGPWWAVTEIEAAPEAR